MAFETNSFSVVRKKKLKDIETNVECNVSVETTADISKVLSVSANVSIENLEVLSGEVVTNGKIDLCVITLNSEGEIASSFGTCPFTARILGEVEPSNKAIINACVVDSKVDSINGTNIRINTTVRENALIIQNQDVKCIKSADDNIAIKEDDINVISYIGEANSVSNEEAELNIKEPIKKILQTTSDVYLKEVNPGVNFITMVGEVISRVLYITENDKFESTYISSTFKEEVELEGVNKESIVEGEARVKQDTVKTTIENLEKGVKVVIETPIYLTARAFEEKNISVASDMYSLNCDLEVITESFEMSKKLPCDLFDGKIEGSLTLDEESPRVDKILCTSGHNSIITNTYISNGEVFVEGIAYANVIYLNDDLGTINSVQIEIPYQVSDKTNCPEDSILISNVVLSDVDVIAKKGREIFFDAKLKVCVCSSETIQGAIITGATEGDALLDRDYGLEIYFAKEGMTAWDIAKELKVKENVILMQNPEAIFPLQTGQNIVVFYHVGSPKN